MPFELRWWLVIFFGGWLLTACEDRAVSPERAANGPDAVQSSTRKREGAQRSQRQVTQSSRNPQWDARGGGDARYHRELERRTAALGGPARMPHLTDPFDGEEFRTNVESFIEESKSGEPHWKLALSVRRGIERLAVDQNPEFDEALQDPVLRQEENLLPFLLAYDFQAKGDHEALDQLLEIHRTHGQGDSNSLAALKNVDDWEDTAEVLYGPNANFDGAGGDALSIFMEVRRALYPENFEKYEEVIRWRPRSQR